MLVEMRLTRIIVNEVSDQQVIFLKEVDGDREFPILIGMFEATSIHFRIAGRQAERPLTHDLVVSAIEQLGGTIDSVAITGLEGATYFAKIRIIQNGELLEIDARPSDAVAVAVTYQPPLPIYVSEEVLVELAV